MPQLKFGAPRATIREFDRTFAQPAPPAGIPAGVIGTAPMGPAFVPVTVGSPAQLEAVFGTTKGKHLGLLAARGWLKSAPSLTYVRVLGAGSGLQRETGTNAGRVSGAGFVVGEDQPSGSSGELTANPFAVTNGVPGRAWILGAFMSESAGSTVFSAARLQGTGSVTPGADTAVPIVRGVLFAPSGVLPRLSSSVDGTNAAPSSATAAADGTAVGTHLGSVVLLSGGVSKQEFVLLLNGHKSTSRYPNVITASFDSLAPNWYSNVLNRDPAKLQDAGHYLYSSWTVHPSLAVVTGAGLVYPASGAGSPTAARAGAESAAFLVTSSLGRNVGSSTVPNWENWEDRYSSAATPWIVSQRLGGSVRDLFRFVAIGSGRAEPLKIAIENISLSTDSADAYCSFDVIVRRWDDRDSEQIVLEQFRGVNLDPTSERYVARVVGDVNRFFDFDLSEPEQKLVVEGSYANESALVRVEVSPAVADQTIDSTAVPFGFRGPRHIVTSGSAPLQAVSSSQLSVATAVKRAVEPPLPYRQSIAVGSGSRAQANAALCWGVQFEHVTDPAEPNGSIARNDCVDAYSLHFPLHATSNLNVWAGRESVGALDTAAGGIVDADRFAFNLFSLENVRVVTASTGLADPEAWAQARYVRDGVIVADETAKTRALQRADLTTANKRFVKFVTLTQGGFDGTNVHDADEALLSDGAVAADVSSTLRGSTLGPAPVAYNRALRVVSNVNEVDVQVFAIPGIRQPTVTDAAIAAAEERFDAVYLMDPQLIDSTGAEIRATSATAPSPNSTTQALAARSLNTSFAATYFPDVVMSDDSTGANVTAPASAAALAAMALSDKLGKPWLAPAGVTRGAVVDGVEPRVLLSQEQADALYDAGINPIVSFPSTTASGIAPRGGVAVYGQKTLLPNSSALNRVNVRRLLIAVRRIVRAAAQAILFEPNRESTLAAFSNAVNPQLVKIQRERGLAGFRVVVDSSTTTQADVENNTVRGKILLAPLRSTEFVAVDFVVTNGGVR